MSYHVACHLRVQNLGLKTRDVLALVPGTQVEPIERCSGHDGTYGVKKEYRDISMKIGRPVFNRVAAAAADHYSSDCPMAGRQIESGLASRRRARRIRSRCCARPTESEPWSSRPAADPTAKLRPADLLGLERYARERGALRPRVIAHKKRRTVHCGPNATLCFEDRVTVQYQVQEMLRIERIFEAAGHRRRARRVQPADPGRLQLEGDLAGRVPRSGGAPRRARGAQGNRGPLLGRGRGPRPRVCDR